MAPSPPERRSGLFRLPWRRLLLVFAFYAAIFAIGSWLGKWLVPAMGFGAGEPASGMSRAVLWTGLVLYAALLAVPFVPGMEISIALFAAFGSAAAVPIYIATLVALAASFGVGRMVPLELIARAFASAGFERAHRLVSDLAPRSPEQRLALLTDKAPGKLAPALVRYRYLAIVLSLNMPGNAVLGGGGGIALLAGISRLYSFPGYLLAIAVAVLPIPLAVAMSTYLP